MATEIEEATIVTEETPDKPRSLQERISKATTQVKTPGANTSSNFIPPAEKEKAAATNNSNPNANTSKVGAGWKMNESDFDDDDDDEADSDSGNPNNDGNGKKIPFTKKSKEASARIVTRSFNSTQRLAFTAIQNRRLKKKFDEKEIDIVDKYEDKDRSNITDPLELKTLSKWDRLMKNHERKLRAIPMTPDEKGDMIEMVMEYQDFTQELLSPAWAIAMSITDILVTRTMDVFMD